MKNIDLHGTKHIDVKRKLDIFFWQMLQEDIPYFEVITGRSKEMKNIVLDICKEYGFTIQENLNNLGCLFIIVN